MAAAEDAEAQRWASLKQELQDLHEGQNGWAEEYIDSLRDSIQDYLVAVARTDLQGEDTDRTANSDRVHAYRRLIAGLHQQIELHSQDLDDADIAAQSDTLIFSGRR